MYKLLSKEHFDQMLEHLVEKYLLVIPNELAEISSQPPQSNQSKEFFAIAQDNLIANAGLAFNDHASLYDASDVDCPPSSGYDRRQKGRRRGNKREKQRIERERPKKVPIMRHQDKAYTGGKRIQKC